LGLIKRIGNLKKEGFIIKKRVKKFWSIPGIAFSPREKGEKETRVFKKETLVRERQLIFPIPFKGWNSPEKGGEKFIVFSHKGFGPLEWGPFQFHFKKGLWGKQGY